MEPNQEKDKTPKDNSYKPKTSEDIFNDIYKDKEKLTPTFKPGIGTNIDIDKATEDLGLENRPELGTQYLQENIQKAEGQKIYQEAKKKADDQGLWGELVGFSAQVAAGAIGGTLEGIGTLLDPNMVSTMEEDGQSLGKSLTDLGTKIKEDTKEALPIYVNPEAQQAGFAPWSREWWLSGTADTVGSVLGFLIPVAGEAKLVATAGQALKGLSTLGKAGKLGQVARKTFNIVDALIEQAPEITSGKRWALDGIHKAVVSRQMESSLEAKQAFEDEFKKLTAAGIPEAEARQKAGDAAAFTYRANWAMLISDIPQYLMLARGPKMSKVVDSAKLAKAAGLEAKVGQMNSFKAYLLNMASEGGEEAYQFVVSEEGQHMADVQAGLAKESDFGDRLGQYAKEAELWSSAFFGALGGAVFHGAGPKIQEGVNKYLLKNVDNYMDETTARINEITNRKETIIRNVVARKQAVESGDEDAVKTVDRQMAFDIGVNAAKVGNLDLALNGFDQLRNSSQDEQKQLGLDEDFIKNIDEHKQNIRLAASFWQDNVRKYGEDFATPIAMREYTLHHLNQDLPNVKKTVDNLVSELPRISEISVPGKQAMEAKLNILGSERTLNILNWKLNNQKIPVAEEENLVKQIQSLSESISNSKDAFDSTLKEFKDQITDADQLILKSLDGKHGEELAKAKSINNLYNSQIDTLTTELSYLTSKAGQEAIKDNLKKQADSVLKDKKQRETKQQADNEEAELAGQETSSAISLQELEDMIKRGEISEDSLDPKSKEELQKMREGLTPEAPKPVEEEHNEDEEAERGTDFSSVLPRDTKKEVETVSATANTSGIFETPENPKGPQELWFGDDKALNVALKTPNALAWKSVYNTQSNEEKPDPAKKALSDFLEGPYDLSKVTLKFEIDLDYLHEKKYKSYKEILDALANKRIPAHIGEMPVKAILMQDGKQVSHEGHNLAMHLHDDIYQNFDESIREEAIRQIKEQKTSIAKAYFEGLNLESRITNKSNGHLNTQIDGSGKMAKFPLNNIFSDPSKIEFTYGSNDFHLDSEGNPVLELGNTQVTNGAIYAKVKTANGTPFPLRTHVDHLTRDEAYVVYKMFNEVAQDNKKLSENISQDYINGIKNAKNPILNQVATYLDLDNITYKEILNHFVFNGFEGTKNKGESQLWMSPEGISKEGAKIPSKVVFGKYNMTAQLFGTKAGMDRFMKHLQESRRRQIDVKLLGNLAYKKYLVENNILTSNAVPNDKGRLFVQPTIAYDPNFKTVEKEKQAEKTSPLPKDNHLEQEYSDELEADNFGDTETSILDAVFPVEKTPANDSVKETPQDKAKEVKKTPEDIRKKRREEALKRKKDGNNSAFKTITPFQIDEKKDISGKEIKHIRGILPKEVSIQLEDDYVDILDNGELAVGLFTDNMIYLSLKGPRGTGYHEAFHAVFRSMLKDTQRKILYSEAEKLFGEPSRAELNRIVDIHKVDAGSETFNVAREVWLEENMADEFPLYMDGQSIFNQYPKGIKGFFSRIKSWLRNVFSNKLTIHKLFRDIKLGKYKNSKLDNFWNTTPFVYKTLVTLPTTGDTFTPEEVKEITQQLAFAALKDVSNIEEIKHINTTNVEDELYNLIAVAVEKGDTELEDRANKVLNNFTYFINEIKGYIGLLGLEESEELIEDEDGNQIPKSSYEVSGKQNATKNIKFLIALTPKLKSYNVKTGEKEYDTKGTYLGLPRFADFGNTWNKLERHLSGIVPIMRNGSLVDSFDLMLEKLESLVKYHPELGYIKDSLVSKDFATKTQFHFTFSRYKGNYIDHLISGAPGAMISKIASADAFKKERAIADLWAYNFSKKMGVLHDGKLVYSEAKVHAFKELYAEMRRSLAKDSVGKELSSNTVQLLDKVLGDLGVTVSADALKKWIEEEVVSANVPNEQKIIAKANNFVFKLDKALVADKTNSLFNRRGPLNSYTNHILDQKFFHTELAGHEAEFQKVSGESTIIGPDGNKIWTYQDNNLISKTIAEINSGDRTHIEKVLGTPFGMNSIWGKWLKDEKNKLSLSIYGNYKEEGTGDAGDKASNLKEPDKINDIINKYLKGVYVGLAEADKSQQYYFEGPEIQKSQVSISPTTGELFYENLNSNSVKILTNYFADEVNRMVHAYHQLHGEQKLKPEDQIMYYHFSKNPGDGKGNCYKSYLFPSMDLKALGIFNEFEMPSYLKEDNMAVKKHIEQAFLRMVQRDLDKATEYGIISKQDKGYSNRTIDATLLNSKYDGNVVKAIADYTLNSIITNVEQCKLFNGDPALYKWKGDGFEDFRKRIPAGVASGKDIRIFKDGKYEVRSHYTSATIGNIETPSSYFSNEENLRLISKESGMSLEKTRAMFKAYSEVNQTDAQAWITIQAFRERSIGYGKWDYTKEQAYDRIVAGKELPEDNELFTQSLKTVHTELKYQNGVMSMQYNKQSEAVLLPIFKKTLKIGKLLEAMEQQKVDHVIVLDGKKAGAMGVSKVDKDGEIMEAKDIKLHAVALSYKNLMLQQDLPTKQIKDTQVGSQPAKNVLATLNKEEDYHGMKGDKVLEEYNETISKLSDLGLIKIKKELGVNPENNKLDKPKFYKALTKVFNTDNSSNILNALKAQIPLDAIPQKRRQIQNKLNAMVTKKAVKLKQLGGAMIQVSNFGFTSEDVKLSDQVKNGIIWFKDSKKELQPARLLERDGVVKFKAAQVLIPFNVLRESLRQMHKMGIVNKDISELSHEEIKSLIHPDVLKGFSYRIPNQGPASNDVFEIAGILPDEMGDTMVAFKEITTKTGSDFDIDKAYIILPNFSIDKESGKIVRVVGKDTEKGLQNYRLELMQKLIAHTSSYVQSMAPLDDPWLKNLATKLYPEKVNKDDLFFFTGTNQIETKSLFDNAKNLVGVIANHMTHHNLAKHEDLYYNGYYIGLGPKKKVIEHKLEGDQEVEVSEVSVEKDEAGNLVEVTLGAYMNAIVDAAKDPFISRANINQFTAPTAFMLARAGVDREWITAFIGQPALVELVSEMSKTEGRISEDQRDENGRIIKALDKILKKYSYTKDSGTFIKQLEHYNLKDKNGNIKTEFKDLTENLVGRGNIPQLNVLGQFLEWQTKAKDLNQFIRACKSDTNGATKNLTSATLQNNLVIKLIKDNNIVGISKFLGATMDENGDLKMDGKKMIGTYHRNSVQAVKEMFGDLFMTETPAFSISMFNMATNAGYAFLQDLSLADILNDELYAATMSDSPVGLRSKKEIKKLLYGKSAPINWGEVTPNALSLSERVLAAKDRDVFKDNNLIQSLDIKPGNYQSPSLIYLSPKNLDKDAKDNLYLAWEEILEVDKELGEDLIKYAFYSSGFKQNFGVFFEHIPTSWMIANGYVDSINKKMKDFQDPSHLSEKESQIFKHLYKNNRLVPNAPNKAIKQINNIPIEFAFAINSWEAKELIIGTNNKYEGEEMKRFLKRTIRYADTMSAFTGRTHESQYLYQLAGYIPLENGRQAIYVRTNTLGYSESGLIIKEYGENGETSIFPENNVTLPQEVEELLGQNLVYPERVWQGSIIDRIELEKLKDEDRSLDDDFNTCINRE